MEFKDYYKIMGLSENASQDDIKKAYRKLARKYHPDVSKESNAEEKFKEVGEAYEVLKDPQKRAEYDQLKAQGYQADQEFEVPPGWQRQHGGHHRQYTNANPEEFSDFFESMFGGGFQGGRAQGQYQQFQMRGEDQHAKINISLQDAFHGTSRAIQLAIPEMTLQGQVIQKTKTLQF